MLIASLALMKLARFRHTFRGACKMLNVVALKPMNRLPRIELFRCREDNRSDHWRVQAYSLRLITSDKSHFIFSGFSFLQIFIFFQLPLKQFDNILLHYLSKC